jgi:stage II sporulation protein M
VKINSLSYLVAIKSYVIASATLFLAFLLLGYLYAYLSPERAGEFFSALQSVMSQKFGGMSSQSMTLAIFMNNLVASFLVLFFGIGFGLLSVLGVAFNASLLGMVVFVIKERSFFLLFSIFPHGIVELPIFLISAAIGLRLGHETLRKLLRKEDASIARELKRGLFFYITWIVPLLLLAAFIETYISLRIAQFASQILL